MVKSNQEPRARLWQVGAFTLAYLTTAVIAAWGVGNAEFGIYIGVMFVLIALVGVLHWRIGLSAAALWGLSLWGLRTWPAAWCRCRKAGPPKARFLCFTVCGSFLAGSSTTRSYTPMGFLSPRGFAGRPGGPCSPIAPVNLAR